MGMNIDPFHFFISNRRYMWKALPLMRRPCGAPSARSAPPQSSIPELHPLFLLFPDDRCGGLRNRLIMVACTADRDRTNDLAVRNNGDSPGDAHK